jgi:hypothetical protein
MKWREKKDKGIIGISLFCVLREAVLLNGSPKQI